ncbi:hypothetical protein JW859_05975 [bacterium]|nr:hypothetical protein [bacterium]
MIRLLWVVVVLTMLVGGCSGGSDASQLDDDLPGGQSQYVVASNERMPLSDDSATATVEGLLTVIGFTIINTEEGGGLGDGASAVSQVSDMRVLVRLVDPEEDILSEVNPDLGGRFSLDYTGELSFLKLQVEFAVAEDLDGDGTGGDLLSQAVPIALQPGRVAQVNLEFKRNGVSEGMNAPIELVADSELLPTEGEMLLVELASLDANGAHEEFYGVVYSTQQVIYDVDQDDFLEAGDDYVGTDGDANGWVDNLELSFDEATATAATGFEGVITDVDVAEQTFALHQADGSILLMTVDTFTAIELSDNGQFYGQLTLASSLIGRRAYVKCLPIPNGYLALWVVVPDQPTK